MLQAALKVLKDGGLVGMPTETVYGLAGVAGDPAAVAKIFALKQRPTFNPLIAHVPDLRAAQALGQIPNQYLSFLEDMWPGPLTVVVPLKSGPLFSEIANNGLGSVAIRVPRHPVAQALLRGVGVPLVAPSANLSGTVSPVTAAHVQEAFPDLLVLDGGASTIGVESTILDLRHEVLRILRPGAVTLEKIRDHFPTVLVGPALDGIHAPGQLARHYAPGVPVRLNVLDPQPGETVLSFGRDTGEFRLSPRGDLTEAASNLFQMLRQAAALGRPLAVDPIPMEGIGLAINDRLKRAAV